MTSQAIFFARSTSLVLDRRQPGLAIFSGGGVGGVPSPLPPSQKKTRSKKIFEKTLALALIGASVSSTMIEDLKIAALKRIEEVYERFDAHYQKKFVRPTVKFDLRGNRSGVAYFHKNLIRLNVNVLLDYKEDFIKRTPGHEVAHLVSRNVYGAMIRSHGPEWQIAMHVIGQPAERCHSFVVKTENIYHCKCEQVHYLSTRMHNQIMRGEIKATCKNCQSVCVWEKILSAN